ncbi:MAG: hypothetical protein EA398_14390 [Deltaproteobacteria bacterium]|nr:MAG: hypothetical protein EA398_14390 [Deltaproteobacteria bacterium]
MERDSLLQDFRGLFRTDVTLLADAIDMMAGGLAHVLNDHAGLAEIGNFQIIDDDGEIGGAVSPAASTGERRLLDESFCHGRLWQKPVR